uniref:SMODS and SLOG-associating 2TM effector domain-containing protein n=1 Tax=viral metagenome TaxID=1070528 RepID=A0A6C0KVR8_9ZZZZ
MDNDENYLNSEREKEKEKEKERENEEGKEKGNTNNSLENKKSGWTRKNVKTLYQWIIISSFNINSLERTISLYRGIIRRSTIFGLIVSTLSGTISATQINQSNNDTVKLAFNILFTALSFSITIFTGYIKVYRIQEQLEEFIRIKQEWIAFSTTIISEIQLPLDMRQSAYDIIKNNKTKYLDLLKADIDIPEDIIKKTQLYMKDYIGNTTGVKNSLTDMLLAVSNHEHKIYEREEKCESNHSRNIEEGGVEDGKQHLHNNGNGNEEDTDAEIDSEELEQVLSKTTGCGGDCNQQ